MTNITSSADIILFPQQDYAEIQTTPIFEFEKNFDFEPKQKWMQENWRQAIYIAAIYIIGIHVGKQLMEERRPFQLKWTLFVWNASLAVFSTLGAVRTWSEFLICLNKCELFHCLCNKDCGPHLKVTGFWMWMFVISKLPELIDTLFIILRKHDLIFLHWYHHSTILIMSWFGYSELPGPGRLIVAVNYSVHSCMYSYFALRVIGIYVPVIVRMCLTALQILQMSFGCYVAWYLYSIDFTKNGKVCDISGRFLKFTLPILVSYLFLFAHFFYTAYFLKSSKKKLK